MVARGPNDLLPELRHHPALSEAPEIVANVATLVRNKDILNTDNCVGNRWRAANKLKPSIFELDLLER